MKGTWRKILAGTSLPGDQTVSVAGHWCAVATAVTPWCDGRHCRGSGLAPGKLPRRPCLCIQFAEQRRRQYLRHRQGCQHTRPPQRDDVPVPERESGRTTRRVAGPSSAAADDPPLMASIKKPGRSVSLPSSRGQAPPHAGDDRMADARVRQGRPPRDRQDAGRSYTETDRATAVWTAKVSVGKHLYVQSEAKV